MKNPNDPNLVPDEVTRRVVIPETSRCVRCAGFFAAISVMVVISAAVYFQM